MKTNFIILGLICFSTVASAGSVMVKKTKVKLCANHGSICGVSKQFKDRYVCCDGTVFSAKKGRLN